MPNNLPINADDESFSSVTILVKLIL